MVTKHIIILTLLLILVNLGAYSTYDYFYGLEQEKCEKILNIEYQNPTEAVETCINYEVSEFWYYTLPNYLFINFISIFLAEIILILKIGSDSIKRVGEL